MEQTFLVSSEVVRRIREQQAELLRSLGHVQLLCEWGDDEDLRHFVSALHVALRDHVGRVDGVLKAAATGLPLRRRMPASSRRLP